MNPTYYKYCIVPKCESTSIKTPNKLFIYVPNKKEIRLKWLTLARKDAVHTLSTDSRMYFCEDHFDLPNDMVNYIEYHVMGKVSQIRMKPNCMPTKFACQPDRRKRTCPGTERPYFIKKQRMITINECLYKPVEEPVQNCTQSTTTWSIDTSDTISGNMTIAHLPPKDLRTRYLCIDHFDEKSIMGGIGRTLSRTAVPRHYLTDPVTQDWSRAPSPDTLKVLKPIKVYEKRKDDSDNLVQNDKRRKKIDNRDIFISSNDYGPEQNLSIPTISAKKLSSCEINSTRWHHVWLPHAAPTNKILSTSKRKEEKLHPILPDVAVLDTVPTSTDSVPKSRNVPTINVAIKKEVSIIDKGAASELSVPKSESYEVTVAQIEPSELNVVLSSGIITNLKSESDSNHVSESNIVLQSKPVNISESYLVFEANVVKSEPMDMLESDSVSESYAVFKTEAIDIFKIEEKDIPETVSKSEPLSETHVVPKTEPTDMPDTVPDFAFVPESHVVPETHTVPWPHPITNYKYKSEPEEFVTTVKDAK